MSFFGGDWVYNLRTVSLVTWTPGGDRVETGCLQSDWARENHRDQAMWALFGKKSWGYVPHVLKNVSTNIESPSGRRPCAKRLEIGMHSPSSIKFL